MKLILLFVEGKAMLAKIGLLLLALSGLLGMQSQHPRTNATHPASSEVTTVKLCDLLSKPAEYHGREVRVRAQYHIGFEYSYFDDPSCKEYEVETTPYWTGNVVWAEFDKSVERATEPEVYRKFKKEASLCCPSGWQDSQAELVVTGRFFKAGDKGYGHFERYALQIVVTKVESVCNATTANP